MKKFFYLVFALFFNFGKILPLKKDKFAFLHIHPEGEWGSLSNLEKELKNRCPNGVFYRISPNLHGDKKSISVKDEIFTLFKFLFVDSFRLASCGFVFLNDNFMPMAYMSFKKDAKIVQLWHGEGAFKRFGLATALPEKVRKTVLCENKRLTYAVCSSENIRDIYSEAFGIPEDRVLPLGSARADSFFGENKADKLRKEFDKKYPQCKGKKLAVYAPTFRDEKSADEALLRDSDINKLPSALGREWILLIKLHPACTARDKASGAVDVTGELDINAAVLIADALITDYSSVAMDFALLKKPVYFYPFDLKEYSGARDFYFSYEEYVPGDIFLTADDLAAAIKSGKGNPERAEKFIKFNFDYLDDKNCERIADFLLSTN